MHAIPILPVHDLAVVADVHRTLGLQVEHYDESYAWVRLDGHELWHLALDVSLDPAANRSAVYVHVAEVDDVHRHLTAAGLPVTDPVDEPWGMRECRLRDPAGNLLRIGTPSAR